MRMAMRTQPQSFCRRKKVAKGFLPNEIILRGSHARPVRPCGKHSPAVRKKMLPFVLAAWPTACGYRPKMFRHNHIGVLTL